MFEINITGTPEREQATFVVGFGDAVRQYVENGDVDQAEAEREAEQWSYSETYILGFTKGARWAQRRQAR
jgi:hypothetical protein